ncbi:hypothetical protein LP414_06980 [Polaromonas sp. P1(28)-13]|nr:hypothetical protein LP414_06980 [Polaromonas sp. P1(28)-13]
MLVARSHHGHVRRHALHQAAIGLVGCGLPTTLFDPDHVRQLREFGQHLGAVGHGACVDAGLVQGICALALAI